MPFYLFFGEGAPTKIDYRKKDTLILTSVLEDLVIIYVYIYIYMYSSAYTCRWRSKQQPPKRPNMGVRRFLIALIVLQPLSHLPRAPPSCIPRGWCCETLRNTLVTQSYEQRSP